jgi:hypothetical protein
MLAGTLIFPRYVTPDWDQPTITFDEGNMLRELPVLGQILFGMSSFYGGLAIKHHRSFLTHFPGVSTAIRLLYIFAIPLLAWYIIKDTVPIQVYEVLFGIWITLSIADGLHYIMDIGEKQLSKVFGNYGKSLGILKEIVSNIRKNR